MKLEGVKLTDMNRLGVEGEGPEVSKIVTKFFILGLASVYSGLNIRLSKSQQIMQKTESIQMEDV